MIDSAASQVLAMIKSIDQQSDHHQIGKSQYDRQRDCPTICCELPQKAGPTSLRKDLFSRFTQKSRPRSPRVRTESLGRSRQHQPGSRNRRNPPRRWHRPCRRTPPSSRRVPPWHGVGSHSATVTRPPRGSAPRAANPFSQVTRSPDDGFDGYLRAAIHGDRGAVDHILRAIRPLVLRYCRARLGRTAQTYATADDVAQEVCIGVLTSLSSYRDQGRPFLAFVYGIAAHKVIDAQRRAVRDKSELVADVPDVVDISGSAAQDVLRFESTSEMRELLEVLPEKQREILILRVVHGLSAEETAQVVGSTAGGVRIAQHRALARLRGAMRAGR